MDEETQLTVIVPVPQEPAVVDAVNEPGAGQGFAPTFTVTLEFAAGVPAPVHLSEKVVVAYSAPVLTPFPDVLVLTPEQAVALLVSQLSVVEDP